jgi:hypothetical protein
MALEDFARQVANEPDGEWNGYLSGFWPIDAVIMCAFQAGTLDQRQADRLWDMEWTDDFAAFVAPDDELIASAVEMADLPAGYFLAFIEVDQPPSHGTLGRRHLLHAMISLGDGFAVGCRNSLVGLPSDGDAWQVVDLARDLNWLPPGVTNGYDVINAMPTAVAKSRPIRLRRRWPAVVPGPVAGRTTGVGVWGHPEPSSALADRIVAAAAQTVQSFKVVPSDDATDPVYRPSFTFRISRDDYELFFNSPNELRGHYYASAEHGNSYTAKLLRRIVDAINWNAMLPRAGQFFDQPLHGLQQSFLRGKIWTSEETNIISRIDWALDQQTDRHLISIPPNKRWSVEESRNERNWQAFLGETGLRESDLPAHIKHQAIDALTNRFRNGGYAADNGADYFYTRAQPRQPDDDIDTLPNIDVKGGWTRADGSDGVFTPPKKLYRGHQIKWFGFT